jgi:E3 ubiquitin-protein ligase SHPRH
VDYLKEVIHVASDSDLQPPAKRRKTIPGQSDLGYIVVKRSSVVFRFPQPSLRDFATCLKRRSSTLSIGLVSGERAAEISIRDTSQNSQKYIYHGTFDVDVPLPPDVILAGEVSGEAHNSHNPLEHGRLWTETEIELYSQEGTDYLRLSFAVKWNIIESPDQIPRKYAERPALRRILNTFFADFGHQRSWSPQDFYDSVHMPEKDDPVAASIRTDELVAELYPFQKRAVRWLLQREGAQWNTDQGVTESREAQTCNIPHFFAAKDENGQPIWVSHLLRVVTRDTAPFRRWENYLRGGLLVEEMGLGKTLEIIALISLHKRPSQDADIILDPYTLQKVRPSPATLLICPPSILPQWMSEFQRHAPTLRVIHYEGLKSQKYKHGAPFLDDPANYDVVLTTYNVLASEIHYTLPPPEREMRNCRKYERLKSPLMQLSWWRTVIDEAQMIESGVSNAAKVARLVPRINAWGVTGTPVKRDVADLLGMLTFLRHEPYASVKSMSIHLPSFQALFKQIALRHTKRLVRDELHLPPQHRYVITIPFTAIEEQYYQTLFKQCCEEIGVNEIGEPLLDDWDPEDSATIERMRTWLVRLRQSALHPEIGGRNRRALGNKDGPLRTVDEVLEAMLDQSETGIRTDQRILLVSKLKRGQFLENGPRVKEALAIWKEALDGSQNIVLECREQLQREIEIARSNAAKETDSGKNIGHHGSDTDTETDAQEANTETTRVGKFRARLRAALEVQHMAEFFCANAYFQIKSNEEMIKPDSADFRELEKLEVEGYERAKAIRQEMLKEIFRKSNRQMRKLSNKASSQDFVEISEFRARHPGGIESRTISERLEMLATILDAEANQLDEWREHTIQVLLKPLVDEDEGLELTGDEYEQSTKTQDEVVVYVQALRALIEDRHDILMGQENALVKNEIKTALKFAKEGGGQFPEKVIELLEVREKLKPPKDASSIRGIISDLRTLATDLKVEAENGSARAAKELVLVEQQRKLVQKQFSEQSKIVVGLRQEVEAFTTLMNSRVEYYRQLQQISDSVAPRDEEEAPFHDERTLENIVQFEQKVAAKVASATSKRRYLLHLRDENVNSAEDRICVICQSSFENGALTVCGHQYCKECISLWWREHHNCPICKRRLTAYDIHNITYKPKELKIAEETQIAASSQDHSPRTKAKASSIYSQISTETLNEIKNIDLDGPSFTTKVDTLARHLLWLRESDPGTKSIIFSQYQDFLGVLARAFKAFRIGFSSIAESRGIEKFKNDPAIECFLLHAKSQSSGLNLVNANHVFLCEPLINTALELQAIARVDRIGQRQATTIWLYLIDGTVEESIYNISVRRRMEHMGRTSKGKSKETTPELLDSSIEIANSLELQQAPLSSLLSKDRVGGEVVNKNDLWECLFGGRKSAKETQAQASEALEREVARHLGAEAAESRHAEASSAGA